MTDYPDQWLIQKARVDGDVVAIDDHTWAIHGAIPVDGQVILAEFATPEEAHAILQHIADGDQRRICGP